MNDLISRQAAIDATWFEPSYTDPLNVLTEVRDRLKALPSAQLELSMEIQEILNYLDTTLHPIVSPDNWNVYAELHDMVSKLPSAQPEIIRCKDCKYGEQDEVGRWFCRSLGCQIGNEDGSGYCADAERRTDERSD